MTARHICFSHGKESGPWGTKIRALADVARAAGWTVESLDYQGIEEPRERVSRLLAYCRAYYRESAAPMALAGSSMGGFVSATVAAELPVRGLFLMAPAFYVPRYEPYVPPPPTCPVSIVHGWRDDVVPWEGSVRYARDCHARLTLIDGDHRLTDNLGELAQLFGMFLRELDESAGRVAELRRSRGRARIAAGRATPDAER